MHRLKLQVAVEKWPLKMPFRIAGYSWEFCDVVLVTLMCEGHAGLGEASGVYYRGESPQSIVAQIESLRRRIEAGLTHASLQELLGPGGARNALDCALWDLEAKLNNQSVCRLAGLPAPHPLHTTFTIGADTPEAMGAAAKVCAGARSLKLKLTGEGADIDRVCAVREARPEVRLAIDGNQGLTLNDLERMMPVLIEAGVVLIEQPFRVGQESLLDGLKAPIPIAADESVQSRAEFPILVGRFDVISIKLDKCGGLTEGLAMIKVAREFGLRTMVSNMLCTSLAMIPAWLLGQRADIVDLDGPTLLAEDRSPPVVFEDGQLNCPDGLWGNL